MPVSALTRKNIGERAEGLLLQSRCAITNENMDTTDGREAREMEWSIATAELLSSRLAGVVPCDSGRKEILVVRMIQESSVTWMYPI